MQSFHTRRSATLLAFTITLLLANSVPAMPAQSQGAGATIVFVCSSRCPNTIPQGTAVTGEEKAWVETLAVLQEAYPGAGNLFISNAAAATSPADLAQRILADSTKAEIVVLTLPIAGLDREITLRMSRTADSRSVQLLVVDTALVGGVGSTSTGLVVGQRSVQLTRSDGVAGYVVGLALGSLNASDLVDVHVSGEEPLSSVFVAGITAGVAAWSNWKLGTANASSVNVTDFVLGHTSLGLPPTASALLVRSANATAALVAQRAQSTSPLATVPLISLSLAYGNLASDDVSLVDISVNIPTFVLSVFRGNESAASLCIASTSPLCRTSGTVDASWSMLMLSGASATAQDVSLALAQSREPAVPSMPTIELSDVVPTGADLNDLTNPVVAAVPGLDGVFIVSYDVSASVFFLDQVVNSMTLVPVVDNGAVIKRYSSIAALGGFLFIFGGQDDTGSLYSELYMASASTTLLNFSAVRSPSSSPPPRCSASLTAVGMDAMILYGGQCPTRVPCNDLWKFNVTTSTWTQLSLIGGPPTGRYFHSALYFEHDFVTPHLGISDSKWIAFAGGRYTTPIFSMYLYGVTTGRWEAVPSKAPAALLPCIGFANGMVVVTTGGLGSVGANSTCNMYDVHAHSWGAASLNGLVSGPQVCTTTSSTELGFTALVARTGGTSSVLQQLVFSSVDCLGRREQNMVLGSDGQSCVSCAEGSTAEINGRLCVSCSSLGDAMERWQIPFCFSTSDRSRVFIGLAIAIAVQLLVVPAIWAVTRVVHASNVAAKNQRAATELSEAVSQMMFERVGYLENVPNPTKIERALSSCVRHMKMYHSFFPASIAVIVDKVIAELKASALRPVKLSGDDGSSDSDASEHGDADAHSKAAGGDVLLPSRSATTRVLAALACGLQAREVSMVVTYIPGFHEIVTAPFANPRKTAAKLTRLVDALIQIVRVNNGVPDVVLGDHIYSSWNAFASVPNHQGIALKAAYDIAHCSLFASNRISVRCGVATGNARVGIFGTDRFRRHTVGTTASKEAQLYAHQCAKFDVYVMCEWTPHIRDVLSDVFLFRVLGEARVARNPPNAEIVLTRSTQARSERVLFAELLGPHSLTQWFYELRGHRELVDIYSTIMRLIFMGKMDEARQVAIPKEMPKWYEVQLRQAISSGELPQLTVDPFL